MLKSKHKKINNSIVHIKGDARRHKFKVLRWMTSDCTFFRLTGCITHWHTEVISGLQYLLKAWLSTKPGVKGSLWQFVHAEASSWWCNLKFSIKYIFKIFYLPGFPNRIVNFKYIRDCLKSSVQYTDLFALKDLLMALWSLSRALFSLPHSHTLFVLLSLWGRSLT